MKRIVLLGLLFAAMAGLYFLLHAPEPEVQESDPWESWDMRNEIQNASDKERNPWKREQQR